MSRIKLSYILICRHLSTIKNPLARQDIYEVYSKAGSVKRAGWVDQQIPDPESIVEHMYNVWLIACVRLEYSVF